MTTATIDPPLKWHGGKKPLASKIREVAGKLVPGVDYITRAHLYGGGFGEGWDWEEEGVSEVYNDLNGELSNLFTVLQVEHLFARLHRLLEATPFSENEWEAAGLCSSPDPVHRAAAFFIRVRQSMAGRQANFSPISRTRTRRQMNEQVSAWLTCIDGLPAVHRRLRRLLILNRPALVALRQLDDPRTLFYLDPPYMFGTRRTTGEYGAFEMLDFAHARLLVSLSRIRGKFILSAYDSPLYALAARKYGWTRHAFDVPNHAASGEKKEIKTEILLVNF